MNQRCSVLDFPPPQRLGRLPRAENTGRPKATPNMSWKLEKRSRSHRIMWTCLTGDILQLAVGDVLGRQELNPGMLLPGCHALGTKSAGREDPGRVHEI